MKLAIQTIIMGVLIFNIDIVQGSDHQKINELKAGASSGYEGREELLGRAISVVLKSLNESEPYQHDVNDALIKMILTTIQFAKNHDMIDQLIKKRVPGKRVHGNATHRHSTTWPREVPRKVSRKDSRKGSCPKTLIHLDLIKPQFIQITI